MVDTTITNGDAWADRAFRSTRNEVWLQINMLKSRNARQPRP
jgi:hypothetical protein